VVEFDIKLAGLELTTLFFLIVQGVLALVVGGLGYYCGRRRRMSWAHTGLVLAMLLAVLGCGLALKAGWDSWNHIESRSNDPLVYERIEDDLGFVKWSALTSIAILAVTLIGCFALYRLALRTPYR
jgi:hypothetical protein